MPDSPKMGSSITFIAGGRRFAGSLARLLLGSSGRFPVRTVAGLVGATPVLHGDIQHDADDDHRRQERRAGQQNPVMSQILDMRTAHCAHAPRVPRRPVLKILKRIASLHPSHTCEPRPFGLVCAAALT